MFDRQKLERLRAKFGDAGGNEIFDPHFRAVADSVFKDSDKRPPPYAGVPTLLRAPFRPDFVAMQDKIDIALLGVPMDLGVTNRSGARFGPRAVRNIERVGTYEHVLRMAPLASLCVADIGDVPLSSRYDLAACHKDIEAFAGSLVAADIVPLSVGGDHSVSLPLLRAVGKDRPVGLIHVDAHCDTSGSFEGCKFHHGGPFRRAVLDGVLRLCTEARDLAVVRRTLLAAGQPYFLGVVVDVNPVSPEMVDQMRRWMSRPTGATGITPTDSLFGSFVQLFARQIATSDKTLTFRTQSVVP